MYIMKRLSILIIIVNVFFNMTKAGKIFRKIAKALRILLEIIGVLEKAHDNVPRETIKK